MVEKKTNSHLADILFPEAREQQDFAEGILSIAPEQRKLHTETYDFTVETITEKLNSNSVTVPNFQRRYVWNEAQASRLIESLIIQCPIPVIYLNQESDETLSVIDGQQRLTSINRYIENQFPLRSLTAYPELEGLRFFELDPRFQRHIMNRTLRCIVILKDTHPQVKFDVFERLNTGATKLTPQELRHGLYYGDLMKLATEAVKKTEFLQALDIKIDKRMKAEELVLRFWALDEDFSSYRKPLSGFINSFADRNRSLTEVRRNQLLEAFSAALNAVTGALDGLAFKIFDEQFSVESSFNSALYDALMIGVSQLTREGKLAPQSVASRQKTLAAIFENDEDFRKSISVATSDEAQLRYRVAAIKKAFGVK